MTFINITVILTYNPYLNSVPKCRSSVQIIFRQRIQTRVVDCKKNPTAGAGFDNKSVFRGRNLRNRIITRCLWIRISFGQFRFARSIKLTKITSRYFLGEITFYEANEYKLRNNRTKNHSFENLLFYMERKFRKKIGFSRYITKRIRGSGSR